MSADHFIGNSLVTIKLTGPRDITRRLVDYFYPWLYPIRPRLSFDVNVLIREEDAESWMRENALLDAPRIVKARIRNENASARYLVEQLAAPPVGAYRFPESGTCLTHEGRQIEVIGIAESLFWDAKETIQSHILRPLMLGSCAMIHSATVVIDGEAWVICGEKGAGKTTLQHHLARGGARFTSTDRTYLHMAESGVMAVGHPGRMRIIVEDLLSGPIAAIAEPLVMEGPRKAIVPLTDVAALLGTQIEPEAPVKAILLLSRRGGRDGRRLSVKWDDKALLPHWLDIHDPMVSDWLDHGARSITPDQRQLIVDNCLILQLDSTPILDLKPADALEALLEFAG
jgi:hypothetical protein